MRFLTGLAFLVIWTGAAPAKEIVPAYVPLQSLKSYDVTVEFNADVHLDPQSPDRRWYFQNGKQLTAGERRTSDSFCYLGTYGDLYEPKVYKKGEAYSGVELVTQVGNQVYLANRAHEQFFFRAHREDLFVVGCEAPDRAGKALLNAGDLYRHLGFNVLLKSDQVPREMQVIEKASEAQSVTAEYPSKRAILRKLQFNKEVIFKSRKYTGWDRSRYIYQNGKLIDDNVNLTGLDRKQVYCAFRFDEDLEWKVTYARGSEFVPARQYNLNNGIVLESDQYKANGSYIRSVSCIRRDGLKISIDDIVNAFGQDLISVVN